MKLGTDLLDDVELHGKTKVNIEGAAKKIRVPWLIVHGTGGRDGAEQRSREASLAVQWSEHAEPVEGANHGFDAKHPLTAMCHRYSRRSSRRR